MCEWVIVHLLCGGETASSVGLAGSNELQNSLTGKKQVPTCIYNIIVRIQMGVRWSNVHRMGIPGLKILKCTIFLSFKRSNPFHGSVQCLSALHSTLPKAKLELRNSSLPLTVLCIKVLRRKCHLPY
jgi:hypothetical protein